MPSGGNNLVVDDCVAPDVFDRLLLATAANPAELVDLYREFLKEAQRTLMDMRVAGRERRAEDVRNHAHYLKGSSLIMGALVVARQCGVLEQVGSESDFGQIQRLIEQMGTALAAVERCLTNKLGVSLALGRDTTS